MARKKLLTEGEIRQFMKLANLRPIGQERLSEMGYPGARDDEMGDDMGGEEMPPAEGGDEEMEMDAEMDMDMDAEAGGGEMVSMDDFMAALERAIEEVTGEEADVSEEPGEEEMEMGGDEPEMDMEMGGDEMGADEDAMMEARKGHGGGARSDDPEKNKPGKFGKPDEEKPDKYASGEGAAPDEKPVRRGRESAGHRPDKKKNESVDNMVDAIAERLADTLRKRRDRMSGLGDEGGEFGEPDVPPPEASELEPAVPYDPAEEEELAAMRRARKPKGGPRPSGGGVGMPALGMEEHIVNEVSKRVAARLQADNRREQVVDQLAERIMKRLTNK